MSDVILMYAASIVAGGAGGAMVSWLLQAWIQHRLDTSRQRTIAAFQSNLDAVAAAASFDYQRRLQDYNLFIVKKHEVLATLHSHLLDAQSQIIRLVRGQYEIPQIETFNSKDAEKYMVEHSHLPAGMAAELANIWDSNRQEAISRYEAYLESMRPEYARRAWTRANNYRLDNDLYISTEIARRAAELTNHLYLMLQEYDQKSTRIHAIIDPGSAQAMSMMQELKLLMRHEIARAEIGPETDGR